MGDKNLSETLINLLQQSLEESRKQREMIQKLMEENQRLVREIFKMHAVTSCRRETQVGNSIFQDSNDNGVEIAIAARSDKYCHTNHHNGIKDSDVIEIENTSLGTTQESRWIVQGQSSASPYDRVKTIPAAQHRHIQQPDVWSRSQVGTSGQGVAGALQSPSRPLSLIKSETVPPDRLDSRETTIYKATAIHGDVGTHFEDGSTSNTCHQVLHSQPSSQRTNITGVPLKQKTEDNRDSHTVTAKYDNSFSPVTSMMKILKDKENYSTDDVIVIDNFESDQNLICQDDQSNFMLKNSIQSIRNSSNSGSNPDASMQSPDISLASGETSQDSAEERTGGVYNGYTVTLNLHCDDQSMHPRPTKRRKEGVLHSASFHCASDVRNLYNGMVQYKGMLGFNFDEGFSSKHNVAVLRQFLDTAVQTLPSHISRADIEASIATYFKSRRDQIRRENRGKAEAHKVRCRRQGRKREKLRCLQKGLSLMEGREMDKQRYLQVLTLDFISSEESEEEDNEDSTQQGLKYYKVKKLSWESEALQKMKDELMELYHNTQSSINKEARMKKMYHLSRSDRPRPLRAPDWAINE
ncbi:hypothetical protein CHS0354_040322 [Potamilus streckersoni]|uniref:Uncharacterized protein n=1 Tax=Potamilus streckersoni TaxID=2493646 RepID=A0AAE0VW91_9BIVA|nr:hypothetical protein CHS0354_040322 [Potamilus streckersoni]